MMENLDITKRIPFPKLGYESSGMSYVTFKGEDGILHKGISKKIIVYPDLRFREGDCPSMWYVNIWKKYLDYGLPVVDWMIQLNDNEVLMQDLCFDDYRLYGKALAKSINEGKLIKPLCVQDLELINLTDEELQRKAFEITDKASDSGVLLPYDDPLELAIKNYGTFRFTTLDIANTKFNLPVEDVFIPNRLNTERTLRHIRNIREFFAEINNRNPQAFYLSPLQTLSH